MKTIKLLSYGIGRYDDASPFIIANNSLDLKVELPNVNGEFFLIAKNNDKTVKMSLSKYEPVKIEGLTAGELKAEVKHYLKGVLIKVYTIEPLILKEVDGCISAMPEIAELKKQLSDLSEKNAKLSSSVSDLVEENEKLITLNNERFSELEKRIDGLVAFAKTCIEEIPYISNLTMEEK